MSKSDFDKRYTLIRKLAEGGQGEVHLAYAKNDIFEFNRDVAIKLIKKRDTSKETFLNEIKILSVLKHPNICQIIDVGEIDDAYFLVMEFVDGLNLKDARRKLLEKGLTLNEGAVIEIIEKVYQSLKYAHKLNDLTILHHDVSPQNIMISSSGHIKLIDFGISQILDENISDKVQGRPAYLPDSILNGKETYSQKTDFYSLGVVVAELISGMRPLSKEDFKDLKGQGPEISNLIRMLLDFKGDYVRIERTLKALSSKYDSNLLEIIKKLCDDQYISERTLVHKSVTPVYTKGPKYKIAGLITVSLVVLSSIVLYRHNKPESYDHILSFVIKSSATGEDFLLSPPDEWKMLSENIESRTLSTPSCEMFCYQGLVNLTLGHKISFANMKSNKTLLPDYKDNYPLFLNNSVNMYKRTHDALTKNLNKCIGGRTCDLAVRLVNFLDTRLTSDLSKYEFKRTYSSLMKGEDKDLNQIVESINNGYAQPQIVLPLSQKLLTPIGSPFIAIYTNAPITEDSCKQIGDFQYLVNDMFENNYFNKDFHREIAFTILSVAPKITYDINVNSYPVLTFDQSLKLRNTAVCSYLRSNGILKYARIWDIEL